MRIAVKTPRDDLTTDFIPAVTDDGSPAMSDIEVLHNVVTSPPHRVQAEGDGVRVLFTAGAPAGTTSRGRFSIEHNHIVWLSGSKQGQTEQGLLLMKTDNAYLEQSSEDFCEMVYMEVDGRPGIAAHASLNLPAIPDSDRMLFIPAA